MGSFIDIATPDGTFQAYIARPAVEPAPVVVVIQEIFGINDDLKATCHEMAEKGYIAVSPDLFWRIEPGVSLSHWSRRNGPRALPCIMPSTLIRAWPISSPPSTPCAI
jgi:carboxymethylenebutenolidase